MGTRSIIGNTKYYYDRARRQVMNIFWKHFHKWELKYDTGLTQYYQCECGKRKAQQLQGNFYQPINYRWIGGGDWESKNQPNLQN